MVSGLNRPTLSGGRASNRSANDDNTRSNHFEENLTIPARPRRLWRVSDTGIPSIPPFYPLPLNPRCCAYVADASPSVVAVRVAEALRRQSIAVEYDEETVTATCMTVDRCRFIIHLWKAKSPAQNSTTAMSAITDGSASMASMKLDSQLGIIVECKRISGDVITFHSAISAIKKAAKSHGTGADDRKLLQTGPLEFPRFVAAGSNEKPTKPSPDPTQPSTAAIEGIEFAVNLLRKDRLDAQLRGMEQIVALTDIMSSGLDIAFTAAMAVMGIPVGSTSEGDSLSATQSLHRDWIYTLLVYRELPDEIIGGPVDKDDVAEEHKTKALAFLCGFGSEHDAGNLNDRQIEMMREERVRMGDEYHGGNLRAMALRALTNSLGLLSKYNPKLLYTTLSTQSPHMMSEEVFHALWEDASGASRPPGIVGGTKLASPHEAALAVRCIRLLGQAHPRAKQRLVKEKKQALNQLERIYFIGQATHELMEQEAKRTYRFLSTHT